jgi:F-type H+-transporting ATPase subunit epsilon
VADLFKLSVLTPDRTVFEGEVEYVHAPGTEGYFGVLANHAALVTALASGTLTVRAASGAEENWQVAGGFFEISDNAATVLADSIETAKS